MIRTLASRATVWAIALLAFSIFTPVQGQTGTLTSELTANQASIQQASSLLSTLPEADTLVYINPQRILNEAVPKLISEADLTKMRQQFNDAKNFAGVDPSRIEYVALALRFRKPGADLTFMAPEVLVVSSGDFSADSLVTMARLAMQEKWSEERHGSKALTLVTIDDIAKQSEKNPILKSFSRLGIVALNSNTIAVGNVDYLKAAVDAAEGRERIGSETVNSLLRDSAALISIAGSPLASFTKSFGLQGTEATPRQSPFNSKFGDFYAAITMEGTNFKIRGALNADNPDTAKIINSLISGFMQTAASAAEKDKAAQAVLKMISIAPQENDLRLEAEIPQQMVADFVREQMKPKAEGAKSSSTPVKKRRTRRR